MRIRRSQSLVLLFHRDGYVLYNYITQALISCSLECIDLLTKLYAWTNVADIYDDLRNYSNESVAREIAKLVKFGCLVVDGTTLATVDRDFEANWLWGHVAGLYHFGTKYGEFIPSEVGDAIQRERAKTNPSPPLFTTNKGLRTFDLPTPTIEEDLFCTIARRRSNRILSKKAIPLSVLSECLFYSMRITTILENPGIIDLPLKMTPSGGARNPYEAYVCIRNVKGINPGTYHYSAIDHTLGIINDKSPPAFNVLCSGQNWAKNGGCLVLLVANFERPMWKYRDPFAYRVVTIEAGHIGQNMMLVATKRGFVANPTCALSEQLIEETVGLYGVTKSVMYALVIGKPERDSEWLT
jgi:SagB-type dehydrogenase family enzyme